MKRNEKQIIRASEIGSYLYCNRSWWLKRVEGEESRNINEMARGTQKHAQHARSVRSAAILQRAAYGLIGLA
ncbi:MAG: hypothetical protein AAGD96_25595, partial [Chloroflexota bacterium]